MSFLCVFSLAVWDSKVWVCHRIWPPPPQPCRTILNSTDDEPYQTHLLRKSTFHPHSTRDATETNAKICALDRHPKRIQSMNIYYILRVLALLMANTIIENPLGKCLFGTYIYLLHIPSLKVYIITLSHIFKS